MLRHFQRHGRHAEDRFDATMAVTSCVFRIHQIFFMAVDGHNTDVLCAYEVTRKETSRFLMSSAILSNSALKKMSSLLPMVRRSSERSVKSGAAHHVQLSCLQHISRLHRRQCRARSRLFLR